MKTYLLKMCLFVIFIICLFTVIVQSDSLKIDSLKKVLLTGKDDTDKVNMLFKIGLIYNEYYNNIDALKYADSALKLAKKINFSSRAGDCYFFIASVEADMDNRYESIKNFYSALRLYEKINNKLKSAACFSSIGFNYFGQENYKESFDAFLKALKLSQQATPDKNFVGTFSYIYLAKIFLIQKKLKEALAYDSVGLKMSIAINNKQMAANAYKCFGDILILQISTHQPSNKNQLSSLKKAQENYFESLNNYRAVSDTGGMGDEFEDIASVYIKLNNFSDAQKYLDSALVCAKQVLFKDNFEKSYLIQAQIDSATGNFKGAFDSYKKYTIYRDSIINDKKRKERFTVISTIYV